MSERGVRKGDRFKWWESARSGFQFGFQPLTSPPNAYSREDGRPIKDNGIQVSPDEYDQPPPSTKPLGGEGEIGTGARDNSSSATPSNVYVIPPESSKTIQYLTNSSQIRVNRDNAPIYISGSLSNITLASNPQVIAGGTNQQVTLLCVGSSVTLVNGSGLVLRTSKYLMDSGSLLSLFYGTGWFETSRSTLYGDLGRY